MKQIAEALGDPMGVARSLARKHKLVDGDGAIWCWECRKRLALMPSLHCSPCLANAWRKLNVVEPCCPQREQTEEDFEFMLRPIETVEPVTYRFAPVSARPRIKPVARGKSRITFHGDE